MGTFLLLRELWRLVRGERQRTRKLRWLFGLLRPYRGRVAVTLVALRRGDGRGAGSSVPGRAGDRQRHRHRRPERARPDRGRLRPLGARLLGGDLHPDLSGGLGRPAGAPGPARADLHAPPGDVDRLLHAQQARGADLAAHERRRGARHPGHGRRRDADLEHADAARGGRDPAAARPAAGAGDLRDLPAARDRQRRLPDRFGGRLPVDAGEDRQHHRLSPGDALGRAGGAELRAGAAPPGADGGAQRGEPGRQHADGLPQRRLLPGGRAAVGDRHER